MLAVTLAVAFFLMALVNVVLLYRLSYGKKQHRSVARQCDEAVLAVHRQKELQEEERRHLMHYEKENRTSGKEVQVLTDLVDIFRRQ